MDWYLGVLKKYAVFEGRARRKEYWMFVLFNAIFTIVAGVIDSIVGTGRFGTGVFYYLYVLAVFIPGLAVSVRRLHDVGKSGWFMFIALIPIVGAIWLLVLMCTDGNPGDNKYGANPKGNVYDYAGNPMSRSLTIDTADQIEKLAQMKDAGILTDEEFTSKKQELLMKM